MGMNKKNAKITHERINTGSIRCYHVCWVELLQWDKYRYRRAVCALCCALSLFCTTESAAGSLWLRTFFLLYSAVDFHCCFFFTNESCDWFDGGGCCCCFCFCLSSRWWGKQQQPAQYQYYYHILNIKLFILQHPRHGTDCSVARPQPQYYSFAWEYIITNISGICVVWPHSLLAYADRAYLSERSERGRGRRKRNENPQNRVEFFCFYRAQSHQMNRRF